MKKKHGRSVTFRPTGFIVVQSTADYSYMAPYYGYEINSHLFQLPCSRTVSRGNQISHSWRNCSWKASIVQLMLFCHQPSLWLMVDFSCTKWSGSQTWRIQLQTDTAQLYSNYLKNYYGGPITVRVDFDGHCSGPTIKEHEHLRHSGRCTPDVVLDANKPLFKQQTAFLANEVNRRQFVVLYGTLGVTQNRYSAPGVHTVSKVAFFMLYQWPR